MLQQGEPSGVQELIGEYGIKISSSSINKIWTAMAVTSHSCILKANGSLDIKEGQMTVSCGYIKQRKIK